MIDPVEHVIYKLRTARVLSYPFPHFYVENVFPDDFYWEFLAHLPADDQYNNKRGSYKNRRFASPDDPVFAGFHHKHFTKGVVNAFSGPFSERYPTGGAKVSSEWALVRDQQGYAIGPHTDARWKMISLLFYLPVDHAYPEAGTSIFIPEDHQFTCEGGPHYSNSGFKKVWTAPYRPNSCFGFWKTNNSWHGVDEISVKMRRDVLLFNVYDENLRGAAKKSD